MTDKQRTFLKKYITDDRIDKLSIENYELTNSFINLIMQTNSYGSIMISYARIKPTKSEQLTIEKYVNDNIENFSGIKDEHATLESVCYFNEQHKWYVLDQNWCKGMSNNLTHNKILIDSDGKSKFDGIYNMLIDSEIYSLCGLFLAYDKLINKC